MKAIIGTTYPDYVIPLIQQAQRQIDIVTYDWRWYADRPAHPMQRINIALMQAKKRGIRIRAVINAANQAEYLKSYGFHVRSIPPGQVLHTKLMMIDRKTAIIGSHNLTSNAMSRNIECSIAVSIPHQEHRLIQFFENLYNL